MSHDLPAIDHDTAAHRFTCTVDGQRCVLDYVLSGITMTITHTGVPEAVGGRGIASALTFAAMDTARREGWQVVPACSYAALWLRRHADYADLQA
jgi:uncharacterized protein